MAGQQPNNIVTDTLRTARGTEDLKTAMADVVTGRTQLGQLVGGLESGDLKVGDVNEAVSTMAGYGSQGLRMTADLLGFDKLDKPADWMGEKSAEFSPAPYKTMATFLTKNLQGMLTTETRLTNEDYKRLRTATVGLDDAQSTEAAAKHLKALDRVIVDIFNEKLRQNPHVFPGVDPMQYNDWGAKREEAAFRPADPSGAKQRFIDDIMLGL